METNGKIMTGEESLKIITDMINKTKVNFRQGVFHLLLWGWLILICSLAEFFLEKFTSISGSWYVWLLSIPGVIVSLIYGFTTGRKMKVYSYGDGLYMWTWLGFLCEAIVLFIIMRNNLEKIAPLILMMAAFPTFISGLIIKFRPLIIGGLSMWIISIIAGLIGPDLASLAVAAAMITGYLIPGYLLRRNKDNGAV
jgi:hypothetical protein